MSKFFLSTLFGLLPLLVSGHRCPPCICANDKTQSSSSKPKNDLFISVHPRKIERFMKYFSDGIHQPLVNDIDHTHEDHHEHDRDHQHGVHPMVLDVSKCAQLPNFRGKYLISTLNSPDCPLMEYDEALNFCMQRNLKSISVKENLSISAKEEILSIANKVIPGFWTNGFIKNPIQNIVYWNEIGENIMPDLWAEGQPDGPIGGPVSRMEFCVAVQMTGQTGKLHDKLCNSKMAAVCEKNSMIPNLDFGVFSLQSL